MYAIGGWEVLVRSWSHVAISTPEPRHVTCGPRLSVAGPEPFRLEPPLTSNGMPGGDPTSAIVVKTASTTTTKIITDSGEQQTPGNKPYFKSCCFQSIAEESNHWVPSERHAASVHLACDLRGSACLRP